MKIVTYKLGHEGTWTSHLNVHQLYFIDNMVQHKVQRLLAAYIDGQQWAFVIELEAGYSIEETLCYLNKENIISEVPHADLILNDLCLIPNNLN